VPRWPTSITTTRETKARQAIFWMLHETGMTWAEVGAAFGVGRERAAEIGNTYKDMIDHRRKRASLWREPFAQRLRAAGAIP
jgi:DNA-directed RNA polymerase sigma subunit (sigma70/sigma32)